MRVDQIAELVQDMSEVNLAFVHGVTEPSFEDSDDCEVNVPTRNQYKQNPRTDAKTLSKPEPGTSNRQRNAARQQDRRAQYTGRFRNMADNIANQAAAQARPNARPEPAPRPSTGTTSTGEPRPPSPTPTGRPPTPRPQDERGRPSNRDDCAQVAQRYPSYAREVLQYQVPEPANDILSPADYYKKRLKPSSAKCSKVGKPHILVLWKT